MGLVGGSSRLRRDGFGVVEESGGAEHGGDDGAEAERDHAGPRLACDALFSEEARGYITAAERRGEPEEEEEKKRRDTRRGGGRRGGGEPATWTSAPAICEP